MAQAQVARNNKFTVVAVTAVLLSALLTGAGQGPVSADVTAISGSAYGYYTNVSLFGGPFNPRGPAPTVTLPSTGGDETATDPDGASAVYGPAQIFNSTGPLTVATSGTTGPTGSATSSAIVEDIEPNDPFTAPSPDGQVSSTCTATETGLSGSTEIINGRLVLQDPDPDTTGEEGEVVVTPPVNPAPNTTYEGQIAPPVNDRFTIVFNEQIFEEDAITVNAVHMYLTGPTAIGELIIGQSHCDVVATSSNQAPTATDDAYTTPADTPLTVSAPGVLGNDDDPEDGELMAAKLLPISPPTDESGSPTGNWTFPSDPENGTLTLNADGSFTYTPDDGFTGTDTFPYTTIDPRGSTDTATVTITVGDGTPPTSTTSTSTTSTSTTSTSTTSTSTTSTTSTSLPATTSTSTTSTTLPEGDICDGLAATIVGTEGPDQLNGTRGSDVIMGLGGDDVIDGRGGNDVICGGEGNDGIGGDIGDDRLFGDTGDDQIRGQDGNDEIFTGTGNDRVDGGDGDDEITSQGGNNLLVGGVGSDLFRLGAESTGIDHIRGEDGNDFVNNSGSDLAPGEYFDGGDGNDSLTGSIRGGIFFGGVGDDSVTNLYTGIVYGASGNDLVGALLGPGSYYGGEGNDRLFTHSAGTFYGGPGSDNGGTVSGTAVSFGDEGNDIVNFLNPSGLFCGGIGDDQAFFMSAGGTFYGEEGLDQVGLFFGGTFIQDGECPVQQIPSRFS